MRYFKCANPKAVNRETVAQDVCFAEQEKKNDRQGKGLHYAANALFALVSLAAFVGCGFLIAQIPVPKNPFLFILLIAGKLLLGVGALVVSVLFGHLVSSPIAEKAQKKSAARKRQAFEESLTSLREFYGWKEPCVVTKCYESSDKAFKNHDVCIYVTENELRIAANLKYGFSNREKDLGCYAFAPDEISLTQIQEESFLAAELKAGDIVFRLGRRAKGYIEKNFIFKASDA
jgi:hypothetical protein